MPTPTEDANWTADLGFVLSLTLAHFAHKRTMRVARGLERAPTAAKLTREFGRALKQAADGLVPGAVLDEDIEHAASAVAQPRRPVPMTAEQSALYHGLNSPVFALSELGRNKCGR